MGGKLRKGRATAPRSDDAFEFGLPALCACISWFGATRLDCERAARCRQHVVHVWSRKVVIRDNGACMGPDIPTRGNRMLYCSRRLVACLMGMFSVLTLDAV